MHEYEIFIEEINPCGGEKYSKKNFDRGRGSQPGSICKREWKISCPGICA